MTAIATSPFPIYLDVDGSALENGYLYFGVAGQNPETNPITVYWDSTFETPAAQPIRTSGGYAVRNGSPAMVYFSATDYSITVRDKNRRLVYSKLSTDSAAAQQLELPVADVFTGNGATTVYTLSKTPSGQASLHVSIGGVTQTPGVDYTLTNGSNILTFTSAPPSGTTIVVLYAQSSEALSQISYTIQASVATAGQTVFNLTNQYMPGANTLAVYLNGLRLTVVSDYAETSTSSITLTAGAVAGDELLFVTGTTEINPVSITASAVAYTPAGTGAVATDVQSKLRESVSVLDFGADPTGVADSTAAIQAALTYANGRPVHAPAGTYRITSTITSYNASGVKRPGVRIIGDGPDVTVFDNRVASGYCFDFNHSVGSTTYGNQVWSDGSTISDLSIIGNASVANSSGIKIRGLWSLVFDRVVIKNHTLYGFHADVDTAYNPDMTASVNLAFVSTAISYNKIGIYAPQNQAIPNCSCKNVYVIWNTDAGIIVSSGLFVMSNCGVGFNGYAYSGDFTPSLSYGGFINPLVSDGCPSGIIIKGCEFDGNKPQQIYSAISSGMQVKNCRFGVRREDGELNKYMVVFGADTTVSVFRCYDAQIEHCEINFKGGNYSGVTVRPILFNTYSRYGMVGNNQYFSTATNLTEGTNLFYVTEDARTGGDDGALYAVKCEFQNAVSNPFAYQTRYSSGFIYTIPDDSVVSFRPTFTGGVIVVSGGSSFTHGMIGYTGFPGSVWAMTTLSTGVNLTTGVLTGTTGTDNRLNISSSSGVIYVENRLGSATQIAVKTLPASDLYV